MSLLPISSGNSALSYESAFNEKVAEQKLKAQQEYSELKPSVVILGAGPAGLIRAVDSILNGNKTVVIERNAEDRAGRRNTVALDTRSVRILERHGIIQYLQSKNLVFAPDFTNKRDQVLDVRIGDLEDALKVLLSKISPHEVIRYGQEYERHYLGEDGSFKWEFKKTDGTKTLLDREVDVLVIAEGAHSGTMKRTEWKRTPYLEKIPAIAALFVDKRPKVTGISSAFAYARITISYELSKAYYFTIFLFKAVFLAQNPLSEARKVRGSVVLRTPGQNYLGFAMDKNESQKIQSLSMKVQELKGGLRQAREVGNAAEIESVTKQLQEAEKLLNNHVAPWIYHSFFSANLTEYLMWIFGAQTFSSAYKRSASFLPLDPSSISVVNMGCDRADHYTAALKVPGTTRETSLLLAGDAAATVDPTTGKGLNIAIATASSFYVFLHHLNEGAPKDFLYESYEEGLDSEIRLGLKMSQDLRRGYRPDAATPIAIEA